MTHYGDNPFAGGNLSFDDELNDLLDSATNEDERDKLDAEGFEILKKIFPVFDSYGKKAGVKRVIDTDEELQGELQDERYEELQREIEDELLKTPEGAELLGSGLLAPAVEYRSHIALIAERRLQQYILNIAIELIYEFSNLSDEEKKEQLPEFEETKRIYLVLLRDHFKFNMSGWPAAFDQVTPGIGIAPGIDLDDYIGKASPYKQVMVAKTQREEHELRVLQRLIGADMLEEAHEMVNACVALATIQEYADNIEGMNEPNAAAQRGKMIWSLGADAGLSPESCERIAKYYDEHHAISASV